MIGRPELSQEPQFASASGRAARRLDLKAILDPIFARQPRDHWIKALGEAGVPCGGIRTVGEVCEAPQLSERGVARSFAHPAAGDVRYLASAVRFDDRAPPDAVRPPMLGEHTGEVLMDWLELSRGEIRVLAEEGAFGAASVSTETA